MNAAPGKVAIVTGSGAGIGRATALLMAERGTRLVVADIAEDGSRETVRMIQALGGEAIYVRTDVTKDADCAALVAATLARFGRLDIAFNNAGIAGHGSVTAEYGLANWQRVLDVNLTGVFNCMVHELTAMKQAGGSIINTSSVMGTHGGQGGSAYCAAKHGVIGLTKAAALEYGRYGIRINAVIPGYIETPMTTGKDSIFSPAVLQAGVNRAAFRRLAKPSEVAEMVEWLSSDKASFATGGTFTVDGGLSAG